MFKVNNKDTRATTGVVLVSLLLTLNIFHTLFYSVPIVNFEQVNARWVWPKIKKNFFYQIWFDIFRLKVISVNWLKVNRWRQFSSVKSNKTLAKWKNIKTDEIFTNKIDEEFLAGNGLIDCFRFQEIVLSLKSTGKLNCLIFGKCSLD